MEHANQNKSSKALNKSKALIIKKPLQQWLEPSYIEFF
jgi:hypothetical protein